MPHTLVFCNTIEACRRVENALRRADRRGRAYRLWVYHSAVSAEVYRREWQTLPPTGESKQWCPYAWNSISPVPAQ